MNTKIRHLFSLLLVLVMAFGLIPLDASADGGGTEVRFKTFEDLKNLASLTYDTETYAIQYGTTQPLVIESDLSIPSNLYVNADTVIIPIGVTLSASENFFADKLIVEGTLVCENVGFHSCLISGYVICSGNIHSVSVEDADDLQGLSNIEFVSNDGYMSIGFEIDDMDTLKEAVSMANSWNSITFYLNTSHFGEAFVIDESVSIPENCSLTINKGVIIEDNCTLELNCDTHTLGPVTVSEQAILKINQVLEVNYNVLTVCGTLSISGTLVIDCDEISVNNDNGSLLKIENGGICACIGMIEVWSKELSEPNSVLVGLDISNYSVIEVPPRDAFSRTHWELTYIGSQPNSPENVPTLTGTYTTDLIMPAADLGVSASDSVLRATLTFGDNGSASCTWEAVDLTAFRIFFHDMFVNAYYAMAYGAGITDLAEIEQFCIDSTGLSVRDYMDTLVTDAAMIESFTPASTSGTYSYNADHTAILTDLSIMEVPSDPSVENSFVLGGNTLYLNAASWDKPDYTFVCTSR